MAGTPLRWVKSSYSAQNGECTEVRGASGRAEVRDSKRPAAPHLAFPARTWAAFLGELTVRDC